MNINHAGLLQFDSLDLVPIKEADTLRSVGYMCSHLDHFDFAGEMYPIRSGGRKYNDYIYNLFSISIILLYFIFKLDRITLLHFQPDSPLLKPVLSTFSPTLTN